MNHCFETTVQPTATRRPFKSNQVQPHTKMAQFRMLNVFMITCNFTKSRMELHGAEIPIVLQRLCALFFRRYGVITARMLCVGFDKKGRDSKSAI